MLLKGAKLLKIIQYRRQCISGSLVMVVVLEGEGIQKKKNMRRAQKNKQSEYGGKYSRDFKLEAIEERRSSSKLSAITSTLAFSRSKSEQS